jgi:uncharacterized protein (TIGR02677 family)
MHRRGGDQQKLFKYVTVDEAPEYRAIVDVLVNAAAQYLPAQTLDEVDHALRSPTPPLVLERTTLKSRLSQLCDWGNVGRDRDDSWVTDLQSYELHAFVYEISRAGEVAHEAVVGMEENLLRAVGLQKVALLRVQALLTDLIPRLTAEPLDGAAICGLVDELHRTFKALTGNAAAFLQKVNRIINSPTTRVDEYRVFKSDTIHYLSEFTENLHAVTAAVLPLLRQLDEISEEQFTRAINAAAKESGELVLGTEEPVVTWAELARRHIRGVYRWFIPEPGSEGGGEQLHRVVRRAVLGIGQVVERLREAQLARSDRTASLLEIAKEFRRSHDDEAAHELWHHHFGLNSARHFQDDDVDDAVPYTRDWWSAPAPRYVVKLSSRATSEETVRRASKLANHSSSKAFLAEAARKNQESTDRAATTLVGLGRTLLSRIELTFDSDTLLSLVILLSRAQRAPRRPGTRTHTALSVDGRLRIVLTESQHTESARLRSDLGWLTLHDYEIEITPVRARGHR